MIGTYLCFTPRLIRRRHKELIPRSRSKRNNNRRDAEHSMNADREGWRSEGNNGETLEFLFVTMCLCGLQSSRKRESPSRRRLCRHDEDYLLFFRIYNMGAVWILRYIIF